MHEIKVGVFQKEGTSGTKKSHYHGYVHSSGPEWEDCHWFTIRSFESPSWAIDFAIEMQVQEVIERVK